MIDKMVLLNKTFEEMLEDIEFTSVGFYDILIPDKHQEFFLNMDPPVLNNYFYQLIGNAINKEGDNDINSTQVLDATRILLDETILNSLWRGNQELRYLPVSLKSFFGKKGIVLRIRDDGEGFDYKEKIRLMEQGRVYYKNEGGSGLKLQNMLPHVYSYEGDGNIINICILDENRTKNF